MIDELEKFTITQTAQAIADATGEISKAFCLLKKRTHGASSAHGWFHRGETIFAEASRTCRESLAALTPGLRAEIDELAARPDGPSK